LVEKYYTFLIYFIDLKYITVIVRSDYIHFFCLCHIYCDLFFTPKMHFFL